MSIYLMEITNPYTVTQKQRDASHKVQFVVSETDYDALHYRIPVKGIFDRAMSVIFKQIIEEFKKQAPLSTSPEQTYANVQTLTRIIRGITFTPAPGSEDRNNDGAGIEGPSQSPGQAS